MYIRNCNCNIIGLSSLKTINPYIIDNLWAIKLSYDATRGHQKNERLPICVDLNKHAAIWDDVGEDSYHETSWLVLSNLYDIWCQWRVFDVGKFDILNLRHIFCTKWIFSNFLVTSVTTDVTQFKIKFYIMCLVSAVASPSHTTQDVVLAVLSAIWCSESSRWRLRTLWILNPSERHTTNCGSLRGLSECSTCAGGENCHLQNCHARTELSRREGKFHFKIFHLKSEIRIDFQIFRNISTSNTLQCRFLRKVIQISQIFN